VRGVLLETDRLVLRRFTMSDLDNWPASTPTPMSCVLSPEGWPLPATRSRTTSCQGSWPGTAVQGDPAAGRLTRNPLERSSDGSASILAGEDRSGRSCSGFGSASRRGERATPPRDHAPWCIRASPSSASGGSSPRPWLNVASRRVLEKAGLNFDRIFHQPWPNRVDGGEFGDVEYAVTKDGMAAA